LNQGLDRIAVEGFPIASDRPEDPSFRQQKPLSPRPEAGKPKTYRLLKVPGRNRYAFR
jgi:hypothetical protein